MGGKGRQGVAVRSDILAAKRSGSLAQLPLAEEKRRVEEGLVDEATTPEGQGEPYRPPLLFRQSGTLVRQLEGDLTGEISTPRSIIAGVFREVGLTRDKHIEELTGQAEKLFMESPEAGITVSPESAAMQIAMAAKLKVRGKPLPENIAEKLGIPNPPCDPETGALTYEDDTPEYANKLAGERVEQYFLEHGLGGALRGKNIPVDSIPVLHQPVLDALHFWVNHPDFKKAKGGFKPEHAAKLFLEANVDDMKKISDRLRQPAYEDDQEGYAGLSAKNRITKKLSEQGVILGSAYNNKLFNEALRRWTESFQTMEATRPEQVAADLMTELAANQDPEYLDSMVASPENMQRVLGEIGIASDSLFYPEIERVAYDFWMTRDGDEVKAASFDEFMKKGVAGLPVVKYAKEYEKPIMEQIDAEYEQEVASCKARGVEPPPKEEFREKKLEGSPIKANLQETLKKIAEAKEAGPSPEELIHVEMDNDPDWGIVAPAGSALRAMLVGDAVAYWKMQNDPDVKPVQAFRDMVRKRQKELSDMAVLLSKKDREEIMRQARGDIHGALAGDIISNGAYYYMLAHEAWKMWLESMKGSWKNGKRRKSPVQFAQDVLEKYEEQNIARAVARDVPKYNNDKEGFAGKSAIERAQMRLDQSGLDTGEKNRLLRMSMTDWLGSLGMATNYTPEMAVEAAITNKPTNLRERKEAAGK